MVWRDVTCVAPITLPSHASILTGQYPVRTGVRDNRHHTLHNRYLTLAEILKSRGYQTGAFVSAFVLDSRFGLDQGFDVYDDEVHINSPVEPCSSLNQRSADETTARALSWLEGRGEPWFLFVHYFDPHHGYTPPPDLRSELLGRAGDRENYYGEVEFVDRCLGNLLGWENTIVAVTSDHGEALWEHGDYRGHGCHLFEEEIRIPLIIHVPEGSLRQFDHPVSSVDVMPTLLRLLHIPVPDGLDGRSLFAENREIYSETIYPRVTYEVYSVRDGDKKFVLYDRKADRDEERLFDLAADPGETSPLDPGFGDKYRKLIERYREGAISGAVDLGPEVTERLRSLGYVE